MSLIAELKRRNVIRMAGLYLVGAWLLTQVAGTVLPMFGAPEWIARSVVILLAIGFIPAMIFAWIFELTPDGLKRDSEIPEAESIAPQTAQKMNRLIFAMLVLAVVYFGFDKFVLAPKREAASLAVALQTEKNKTASSKEIITDKSIAVLPFVDMSQAKDQEWFGDGLAEEILNALVKAPDLHVSARTSSFKYKGTSLAVPQIVKELGVAHVLEGSIRSTPKRIRVTAQLIRASDGFHLWSQTYDRDPADMIAIQEDLARNIATVMQTTMDPEAMAEMADVGTRSVEAYQAYLRGRAVQGRQSYEYFEKAREIDPEFSGAHAAAATYWAKQLSVTQFGSGIETITRQEIQNNYRTRIQKAVETAKSPFTRRVTELTAASMELRWRDGIAILLDFQKQRPDDSEVARGLTLWAIMTSERALVQRQLDILWPKAMKDVSIASTYLNEAYRAGNYRQSADRALQLAQRWPDNFFTQYQAHRTLLWDRRIDDAARVLTKIKQLPEGGYTDAILLASARQACAEGRRTEVENLFNGTTVSQINTRWYLLTMLGRKAEAIEILKPLDRDDNAHALSDFLYYPNFDPTPFPSLMRILEREKVKRPPPVLLPFACPPADKVVSK